MEQLAAYGLVRGASGLADFGNDLKRRYSDWRAAVDTSRSRLSEGEIRSIEQIKKTTEELLRTIETAERAAPHGLSSTPVLEEIHTPLETPDSQAEPTKPAVEAEVVADPGEVEADAAQDDRRLPRHDRDDGLGNG